MNETMCDSPLAALTRGGLPAPWYPRAYSAASQLLQDGVVPEPHPQLAPAGGWHLLFGRRLCPLARTFDGQQLDVALARLPHQLRFAAQ